MGWEDTFGVVTVQVTQRGCPESTGVGKQRGLVCDQDTPVLQDLGSCGGGALRGVGGSLGEITVMKAKRGKNSKGGGITEPQGPGSLRRGTGKCSLDSLTAGGMLRELASRASTTQLYGCFPPPR